MTPDATTEPDWPAWLDRWDRQQAVHVRDRDGRFDLMFDLAEALCPDLATVLDLACGPGSISRRVLDRLPDARMVAVDADPVLLAIGQGALGDAVGRLRWIQADLRDDCWVAETGPGTVDVALSATATHWLEPDDLPTVYRHVRQVLRPGGVLLNADHLPDPTAPTRVVDALAAVADRQQHRALADDHAEDWTAWWDALAGEPQLAAALRARDHIGSGHTDVPTRHDHEAALHDAGFDHVHTVWQHLDDRILLAL